MAQQYPDASPALRRAAAGKRPVVYLHVGAPKTGTTYLQDILWRNRGALRRDGILYPGGVYAAHFHAALDLHGGRFLGYEDPNAQGAWGRLVDEARGWDGTVIISHELLSTASPQQVARAMTALHFADVHLIYTARDLARQIPATWQEELKNRRVVGFAEYVRNVQDPDKRSHRLGKTFWRMQDAVEVLGRWAQDVPAERVHVVTVPPPGAPQDILWKRFAGLVGMDPGRYDAARVASNRSLGTAEAALLRRLNLAMDESIRWPIYSEFVKAYLAQDVLAGRPDALRITLAGDDHAWAVTRSGQLVDGLRAARYDVVGDLQELIPSPAPPMEDSLTVDEAPLGQQLDAAVDAIVALLERIGQMRRRQDALRQRVEHLKGDGSQRRRQRVRTLVRDLSQRRPVVMRARVAWWHAAERVRRIRPPG